MFLKEIFNLNLVQFHLLKVRKEQQLQAVPSILNIYRHHSTQSNYDVLNIFL